MVNVAGELGQSVRNIVRPATSPRGGTFAAQLMNGATDTVTATVAEPFRLGWKLGVVPGARFVTRSAIGGAKWMLGHTKNLLLNLPIVPVFMRQGRLPQSIEDLSPPPRLPVTQPTRIDLPPTDPPVT